MGAVSVESSSEFTLQILQIEFRAASLFRRTPVAAFESYKQTLILRAVLTVLTAVNQRRF